MTDSALLERAAGCYLRSGLPGEAARCLREAGAYRRSAELWAEMGQFKEAANDYARAGLADVAVWLLVHDAGDTAGARRMSTAPPLRISDFGQEILSFHFWPQMTDVPDPERDPIAEQEARDSSLRMRLALARCDVMDGRPDQEPLAALDAAARFLTFRDLVYDRLVEEWAVATAESMKRYDQVALLFAAAVRGRRSGAAQRWRQWAARVLNSEITLPDPAPSGSVPGNRLRSVRPPRQG
ncbi:hypothetical protein ACH4SP_28215 [Streptomyces sp. NPDC021093]|uniref:hypothetical protein n=1 Tax=Streptomyces sp. NPDC021093 TaxID=3365112 RepID=UPI00378DD7F7